jgi:tetratricopeptide (TPR) repeat protein
MEFEMGAHHVEDDSAAAVDTKASGYTADDLLALAISQPAAAEATARETIAAADSSWDCSLAHHALAIVERDRGRSDEALAHARLAVRFGRRADRQREAEARATLGTTLLFAGSTAKGLAELHRALELIPDAAKHRVLHLRGRTYWLLGRYQEALADLDQSVRGARRFKDPLWEGRALGTRADVHRAMGEVAAAESDYAAAEAAHLSIGEVLEATLAARNRAIVALERGDVVSALALIDDTEQRYRDAGVDQVEHLVDHVEALLAARLVSEAEDLLAGILARKDLAPVWRADLLRAAARAAMVRENWGVAAERAREAEALFRSHRRLRWATRAALLALEAEYADRRGTTWDASQRAAMRGVQGQSDRDIWSSSLADLFLRTQRLVQRLRALSDPALPEALILLAQVAQDSGHEAVSQRRLVEAAGRRLHGAPLPRAAGWLAAALLAKRRGDRRALRNACRRGLEAIDEHRSLIGDLELRALASGYGMELLRLALADAIAAKDARSVLWWTERWRATALSARPPRAPADPELARDVAALRTIARRSDERGPGSSFVHERTRLETRVRNRYRRLRASSHESAGPDLGQLVDALGDTVLISITILGGRLRCVTVARGRARLRDLGEVAPALREINFAKFTLRRAAHGRDVDVRRAGTRLQEALLGEPDRDWMSPTVLIAPAAGLLTVPFGLLPVFRDTAVSLTPSTTLWRRSRDEQGRDTTGHVALVTGPGLTSEQREVSDLRRLHASAVVLGGGDATVDRALGALDGARLAHIAAHGNFRADAPLFSSLMLADGPLMFHDLDRLSKPPGSVVLSACDSGGVHPIGTEEALGLVASFLAMGTRSIVASVDPVNDFATKDVMAALHATVAAGGSLAEGLLAARAAARADPLLSATAASFNAWGS